MGRTWTLHLYGPANKIKSIVYLTKHYANSARIDDLVLFYETPLKTIVSVPSCTYSIPRACEFPLRPSTSASVDQHGCSPASASLRPSALECQSQSIEKLLSSNPLLMASLIPFPAPEVVFTLPTEWKLDKGVLEWDHPTLEMIWSAVSKN